MTNIVLLSLSIDLSSQCALDKYIFCMHEQSLTGDNSQKHH